MYGRVALLVVSLFFALRFALFPVNQHEELVIKRWGTKSFSYLCQETDFPDTVQFLMRIQKVLHIRFMWLQGETRVRPKKILSLSKIFEEVALLKRAQWKLSDLNRATETNHLLSWQSLPKTCMGAAISSWRQISNLDLLEFILVKDDTE